MVRYIVPFAALIAAAPALLPAAGDQPTVHARDFYNPEHPTAGIQAAIASLPEQGGRVVLEARTYVLRAPIALRNDLTLTGQGPATVLTRGPEIIRALAETLPQGSRRVVLRSADDLRVGDRISIRDDENGGWYLTPGVITNIEGTALDIDHGAVREYTVARHAMVLNHHPMIEAYRIWDYRWHIRRFVIEDLTIDGNLAQNPTAISDWATAAIHLASSADGIVRRCVVRNWITDGISDQYGRFNTFRENVVEHCRGNGFHPGTSVRGSRFVDNLARFNAGDGLFFCADVTGIYVTGNTFTGNGKNGIGGLGGGGDTFNVVSGNICSANGGHGIEIENGRGNLVTGNICYGNSTHQPGHGAGIALTNTTDTTVTGNICGEKDGRKGAATQGYGVAELGDSNRNIISGNVAYPHALAAFAIIGADTVFTGNVTQAATP